MSLAEKYNRNARSGGDEAGRRDAGDNGAYVCAAIVNEALTILSKK